MRVCDGSSVFELQAEPVEAAMAASRSDRTIASPSTAAKRKWALLGRRPPGWSSGAPLRCASGISASTRATRRSRIALRRAVSAGISAAMMSAAAAMPAIEATSSVPERKPRSWPPPSSTGARATPLRR